MKLKNVILVYAKPTNNEQKSALNTVIKALKGVKGSVKYVAYERSKLSKKLFQNKDLVVAVGGDGTFLRASHFVFGRTQIIGVNSEPESKEGFFLAATKNDFKEKLKKILSNEHEIKKLYRLEAYIGNKKIPELALNEFYVSSEKDYHTARYIIYVKDKIERQKSSGILISTAAGSNAWIKSAGGIPLPLESDKFEYLVREPYCGKITAKCALINDILSKNEKIEIVFESKKGIIIADSLSEEYPFKAGNKVTVKISNQPLYSVS